MSVLRQPFQDILKAALITLIIGWLAALGFGLWIAHLQYDEVSARLPPDQINAAYTARIDRELWHSPLLFLPQIGVMAAILTWQVAHRAKNANNAQRYGAVTGVLVAVVESVIALMLQVPWVVVALMWLLLVGAGVFAGWYATDAKQNDISDASLEQHTSPR